MGRRLPCPSSFGRRCYRAEASEPQSVRIPGCMSAQLTTLRGFVRWSKSLEEQLGDGLQKGSSGGPLRSACAQALLFLLRLLPDSLPTPPNPDSQPRTRPEPTPSFGREAPPPAPFPLPQSLFATKGSAERAAKREGAGAGAGARGEAGRPAGGHRAEEQSTGILPGPGRAAMLRIAPAEEGAGPGGRR